MSVLSQENATLAPSTVPSHFAGGDVIRVGPGCVVNGRAPKAEGPAVKLRGGRREEYYVSASPGNWWNTEYRHVGTHFHRPAE
jgi:hypothetical protein